MRQMTREEKRQAKIDYYKSMSQKAYLQSSQLYNEASKMQSYIPFGQPILVGHYSERADRRYRAKIHAKDEKAYQLNNKADYYAKKAEATENNRAIYIEDENSIEKLTEKIEKLTMLQDKMKAANKIVNSKKYSEQQKVEELQKIGFSEQNAISCLTPDYCGRTGFASYKLTNNNARINAAKIQLEKAIRLKNAVSKEYKIGEIDVNENTEENRLQLYFNGKPSEEIRAELKRNGFRWSPSNGCWQSYLNRYQIDRAKAILSSIA